MLNMVASLAPGKSATLTILRHGGQQDIQVRIGKRPS